MTTPILELRDVKKQYGRHTALHGVSFQVRPGEMFGLLGPNGAGKTTLLSIVSCLLPASSGEVRINGRSVGVADADVRRVIGIVPQELALYNELTARENLVFFGELYGLAGAPLATKVDEVLAAVALTDRADRRVDSFSGGMKRRLNLGAALIHEPALLLLDEPTTGVDPQSRNHIFEEIRRVNAAGMTVIYTSHYMEEVQTLCNRVGIIDHGRLIACDALDVLLRRLPGDVRVRVTNVTFDLADRLKQEPKLGCTDAEAVAANEVRLRCADPGTAAPRLLALLAGWNVGVESLDLQEPTLERVFLSLTGSALRDD